MKYLTMEQLLFIHARLVSETGGSHGLRNLGRLQAAAARPKATFDKRDLYKNEFEKAATLMQSMIKNHPFIDGNKRVGVTAAILFLSINGIDLKTSNHELVEFTQRVVSGMEIAEMGAWFESKQE